mgnify:FL=1
MDTIHVEILPDGRLKVTTSEVSAASHRNADQFAALLKQLMGGQVDVEMLPQAEAANLNKARQTGG